MFKPEPMRRVLVAVARPRTGAVVAALHELRALHIREQREGCDGLGLCPPLEGASEASETLIRIRAMISALGLANHRPEGRRPAGEVMEELERRLPEVETEVNVLIEERARKEGERRSLQQRLEALEPYVALGLPMELYAPYESLRVFVGHIPKDPTALLEGAHIAHELFRGRGRAHARLVAIFVDADQADEAQAFLVKEGLSSIPLQEGKGDAAALCDDIRAKQEQLKADLDGVKERLSRVRASAADMLVVAEEHLSIEVEKLESPLRFGGTRNTTIVEGWVPTARLPDLERALETAAGGAYHLEEEEDFTPMAHGRGRAAVANDGGEAGSGTEAGMGAEDEAVEPPVLLRNPARVAPYEMLVTEVSTPSYWEIDPSRFMLFTFPLFFGMMMGDIAYGAITAMGGFLVFRRSRNAGIRKVAEMLSVSGAVAIVFGVVYGEAFGFALYGHPKGLLWAHDVYVSSIGLYLPIDRFEESMLLIKACLYLGIAHLMLGLAIGFHDERVMHGAMHAFLAKGSWMLILIGGTLAVSNYLAGASLSDSPAYMLGLGMLLGGIVALVAGEGPVGILHVPSILSNVLSYIRIFALGLSGLGIAITFNTIAAPSWESGTAIGYIVALLIGVVGHLLNIFLGILGPTMHSLRLHYVEWMTKFYTGGGVPYRPFGRARRYSET
jgi:V/A-type H+-transporting ATPase subunit I